MEDPDSGYTIDQHLAPTAAAAHELANAGHRRILVQLSSREAQQRQVEAHMRRLSAVCLQKVPHVAPRREPEPANSWPSSRISHPAGRDRVGRMSCAANGRMFRIDSSERLTRCLVRLNTGEPANVPTLCAEFAASGSNNDPLDEQTLLGVLARRPRHAR